MRTCDVVIVGAGAAGIAAASLLVEAGLAVELLEARARIGGRAWSLDVAGMPIPVELGPEFVHGTPEVTLRLLHRHGIARIDTSDEAWRSIGGALVRDDDDDTASALLFAAAEALEAGQDCSVEEALRSIIERDVSAEPKALIIRRMVNGFDAADPRDASLRAIAEEWRGDASLATASTRPNGGYRALWRAMEQRLNAAGVRAQLERIVYAVDFTTGGVRVAHRSPLGEEQSIEARSVIVTVPLPLLSLSGEKDGAIAWNPPLPDRIQRSLTGLCLGPVVKAMTVFAEPFWERRSELRNAAFFQTPLGAPFPTLWTTLPMRTPLLTAWSGGVDALKTPLAGSAADLEAAVATTVESVFGQDPPEQSSRVVSHDWQRDPFARGAYSYVRVGGYSARTELGKVIEDRLWIAGEACATGGEGRYRRRRAYERRARRA